MYQIYCDIVGEGASAILVRDDQAIAVENFLIDELFRTTDPADWLAGFFADDSSLCSGPELDRPLSPPIGRQEVWAAGVTYRRSKQAREAESRDSGGDVFYDLVYEAERPELFFKATARRVRGHRSPVNIRSDSDWNVPEPELALAVNSRGEIIGYTIGNDMSSRSIEGENPLYLPQAKIYSGSCALGPCLVVGSDSISKQNQNRIELKILERGEVVYSGSTHLGELKRSFAELVSFLFRENDFPYGAYLLTGTGIVPDEEFTLQPGHVVQIAIEGIGVLENQVEMPGGQTGTFHE